MITVSRFHVDIVSLFVDTDNRANLDYGIVNMFSIIQIRCVE